MNFPNSTRQSRISSPLGEILLAASDRGLVGVWFVEKQRHPPDSAPWRQAPDDSLLKLTADQLRQYFGGERRNFDLPLDLTSGTDFQQAVWRALLSIGYGDTCSYGDVARAIDRPNAVRAVGLAVGRNPVSLIVPCHRVIGANGSLTGYGGGLDRKTALLGLEGRQAQLLQVDAGRSETPV